VALSPAGAACPARDIRTGQLFVVGDWAFGRPAAVPTGIASGRPINASPQGTCSTRPVRLTWSPGPSIVERPHDGSRRLSLPDSDARPYTPVRNSSSTHMHSLRPVMRAMASPTSTPCHSLRLSAIRRNSKICCRRVPIISSTSYAFLKKLRFGFRFRVSIYHSSDFEFFENSNTATRIPDQSVYSVPFKTALVLISIDLIRVPSSCGAANRPTSCLRESDHSDPSKSGLMLFGKMISLFKFRLHHRRHAVAFVLPLLNARAVRTSHSHVRLYVRKSSYAPTNLVHIVERPRSAAPAENARDRREAFERRFEFTLALVFKRDDRVFSRKMPILRPW